MKRLNAILSITIVIVLITGSLVAAQEPAEKGRGAGPQFREAHGRGTMGRGPGPGRGARMRGMGRGRRGGRGGRMGLLQLADELDLSEGQREELKNMFTSHKKEVISQKAEIQLAKVDLQELIRQEDPDLDAVENQLRTVADLEAGVKFSHIKVRVESKNVLTEEQKTALKKLRRDRQAKRKAEAKKPPGGQRTGRGPGQRIRRGTGPRE